MIVEAEAMEVLIGKTTLIGLAWADRGGSILSRTQCFGKITGLDEEKGLKIECGDGKPLWLPPDLNVLQAAPPGEYRLRDGGSIIMNPDFLVFYKILYIGEAESTWESVAGPYRSAWLMSSNLPVVWSKDVFARPS